MLTRAAFVAAAVATTRCAHGSWLVSEHPHAGGSRPGHGGVQQYL